MNLARILRIGLAVWVVSTAQGLSESTVSYQRDIVPILRANCVSCHRADKLKGGLDLSSFEGLSKGGKHGPSFQPGLPGKSRLIEAVSGAEPEMPPEGEALTRQEVKTLATWIRQGARQNVLGTESAGAAERSASTQTYAALPSVSSIAFSPNGELLAVAGRGEVLLHSGDGTRVVGRLACGVPRIESLCFSKDGTRLAVSGGSPYAFGQVQIWDTNTRQSIRTIRASSDVLHGVSLSDDGTRVAVGGSDKRVYVFALNEGKLVSTCDNHIDWVFATAFSRDGSRVASGSRDKAVKLVDAATGRLIDDLARPRDVVLAMARHPNEDWVAYAGEEGKVRLHKLAPRGGRLKEGDDREESAIREFEGMGTKLHTVAFSADGSLLACGGENGEIRTFRTDNGQRVFLTKLNTCVFTLAFHPNGRTMVVAGTDGRLHFLETTKGKTIKTIDSVPLITAIAP